MTNMELLEAMTGIDGRFIENARPKPKKRGLTRMILIAALILFSGQLDYSSGILGAYTIKIAVGKVNLSFAQAFTSGIDGTP